MKNLLIVLAAFFAFSLASCGGDNCETCTMDGETDVEICEGDGPLSGTAFATEIAAQEALGFECN